MEVKMVIIVGDIHGEWRAINQVVERYKNHDLILICCDFGYWPAFWNGELNSPFDPVKGLKLTDNCKILFCDGNHEDHWSLNKLESNEVLPDVFYMKRGSTFELPDGRKILFMGGANSIDKWQRQVGVDWFPEEAIAYKDMMNLPDEEIDILITHTCSEEIVPEMVDYRKVYDSDPSRKAVSQLVETYKPSLWYFGHWHDSHKGTYKNTRWTALSMPNKTGWFEELPGRI